MAITYFSSASVPADNGTSSGTSPLAITPPGSMQTGDLVIVYLMARNASATFSVSNTGGQSWTTQTSHNSSTAVLSSALYWCVFNGTWSASPSFTFSSTTSTTIVMHVFRPSSTSATWTIDPTDTPTFINKLQSFTATSPVNNLGGSSTPVNASTISLAIWSTDDDNTWGTVSGSGWADTGSAQYRNLAGSDSSAAFAHNIKTSSSILSQPSKTEATLGNDPGIMGVFVWYESIVTAQPKYSAYIIGG